MDACAAWHGTRTYELNVKGFTRLRAEVPERLRGTYAGLASAPAIGHLTELGVTTVEFMPLHHCSNDRHLVDLGLSNYWGYNNHLGPTLSLRGIDDAAYWLLALENPRYCVDFTGCGNTLNMLTPRVIQLIMDSLRYWVLEVHVDGFRFDFASALARELYEVDRLGTFVDFIHQDPVVSRVKLIAEPWDVGPGGYQVGNFPPQSSSSNSAPWTSWSAPERAGTTSENDEHGRDPRPFRFLPVSDAIAADGL